MPRNGADPTSSETAPEIEGTEYADAECLGF